MNTTTCPRCGHTYELENKIIELRQRLHFGWDINLLRVAFDRAWRDAGAKRVSTKSVATEAGLSEAHARRGLIILEQSGEIKRVGEKGGWRKLERFERSAI